MLGIIQSASGKWKLITLPLLAFGLVAGLILIQKEQLFKKKAAGACGPILASVSTDGKMPKTSIELPAGKPTKYYIHVSSAGQPCQSSFDINFQICDKGVCGNWSVRSPWGPYKSNSQGVARLDLDGPWPENRIVNFKLRPASSSLAWSNQLKISFVRTGPAPPETSIQDYLIFKPGYAWIYTTKNNTSGVQAKTRLQIEEITELGDCKIKVRPWRFTKEKEAAYWNPEIKGAGFRNRNFDLRWMVVDQNYDFKEFPDFNNYIWAWGHKRYQRSDTNPIRDVKLGSPVDAAKYGTKEGRVPGYNLSLKALPANLEYLNHAKGESAGKRRSELGLPGDCSIKETAGPFSSWKIRTAKDTVSIDNPNFKYSGDALRIDYYEGLTPLETEYLLRESWYFVKNIGLVKILVKHFNRYGGWEGAKNCIDDSDCWADTIESPHVEVTLDEYFQNPTLEIAVSKDGSNYSENITTTKDVGYYLKINNVNYTGYLEAKLEGGKAAKWLWVEKGLVKVGLNELARAGAGEYKARFRIWVPNEPFPNETRAGNANIPWSNLITVILQ